MSKPHATRRGRLTCTDVRFVHVEFPRQIQPRLVIEFSEGLSLLLENQAAIRKRSTEPHYPDPVRLA